MQKLHHTDDEGSFTAFTNIRFSQLVAVLSSANRSRLITHSAAGYYHCKNMQHKAIQHSQKRTKVALY